MNSQFKRTYGAESDHSNHPFELHVRQPSNVLVLLYCDDDIFVMFVDANSVVRYIKITALHLESLASGPLIQVRLHVVFEGGHLGIWQNCSDVFVGRRGSERSSRVF
jgi:hypothetical protein